MPVFSTVALTSEPSGFSNQGSSKKSEAADAVQVMVGGKEIGFIVMNGVHETNDKGDDYPAIACACGKGVPFRKASQTGRFKSKSEYNANCGQCGFAMPGSANLLLMEAKSRAVPLCAMKIRICSKCGRAMLRVNSPIGGLWEARCSYTCGGSKPINLINLLAPADNLTILPDETLALITLKKGFDSIPRVPAEARADIESFYEELKKVDYIPAEGTSVAVVKAKKPPARKATVKQVTIAASKKKAATKKVEEQPTDDEEPTASEDDEDGDE